MKRMLQTLLPWMALAGAAWAGQARSAEVVYTYKGVVPQHGTRVGDECYVPLQFLSSVGWKFTTSNHTSATVTGDDKKARVPIRLVNDQEVVPLRAILDQMGAISLWETDTDRLDVCSPIKKITIKDGRITFDSWMMVKPKVFALHDPERIVVDIEGARLAEDVDVDAGAPAGRVSQFSPNVVRMVLEPGFTPDFPKDEQPPTKKFSLEVQPLTVAPQPDPNKTQATPPVKPPVQDDPELQGPTPSILGGPLTVDLEGPSSALLSLKTSQPVQQPLFRRPAPTILEIVLPGVYFKLEPDFDLKSPSVKHVDTKIDTNGTTLTMELARPMGVEITAQTTGLAIQLLKPKVGDGKLAGKIVVVDAGHGGQDNGAQSPAKDVKEKNLTLAIATYLAEDLADQGATVIMTRKTDVFIPLIERANIANRNGADFFISVHINSNRLSNTTSGSITFYHGGNAISQVLADCILHELVQVSGLPGIGVWSDTKIYQSGFSVLRNTTMPAVLVEMGFINHNVDRKRMMTEEFQRAAAASVVKGLKVYLGDEKEKNDSKK